MKGDMKLARKTLQCFVGYTSAGRPRYRPHNMLAFSGVTVSARPYSAFEVEASKSIRSNACPPSHVSAFIAWFISLAVDDNAPESFVESHSPPKLNVKELDGFAIVPVIPGKPAS